MLRAVAARAGVLTRPCPACPRHLRRMRSRQGDAAQVRRSPRFQPSRAVVPGRYPRRTRAKRPRGDPARQPPPSLSLAQHSRHATTLNAPAPSGDRRASHPTTAAKPQPGRAVAPGHSLNIPSGDPGASPPHNRRQASTWPSTRAGLEAPNSHARSHSRRASPDSPRRKRFRTRRSPSNTPGRPIAPDQQGTPGTQTMPAKTQLCGRDRGEPVSAHETNAASARPARNSAARRFGSDRGLLVVLPAGWHRRISRAPASSGRAPGTSTPAATPRPPRPVPSRRGTRRARGPPRRA